MNEMREVGRNLWLAGLGAVAEAGEGGKEWNQMFDRLVERGRPVGERQRKAFEDIEERTGSTVREMRTLFEDTVQYESKSLLQKLGLMTRDDVKVLASRIDALAVKIDELVACHAISPAISAAEPAIRPEKNIPKEIIGAAPKSRRPRSRKPQA